MYLNKESSSIDTGIDIPIFVSLQTSNSNFSKFIGLYISYSIIGIFKPSSKISILKIINASFSSIP